VNTAVGIDLVAVDEVQTAIEHFGDRYLARVFTPHEIACAPGEGEARARHLATRFAAKEAAAKALRSNDWLPAWRSIEVHQDNNGWYSLRLSGRAAELARQACLNQFALSLSHEGNVAAAVVVAVGQVRS
jgi:holo-[acyl-carrier protein] synthase